MTPSPDPQVPPDAVAALHQGLKIDAIKLTRAATGLGLKESKELVEAYVATHPDLARAVEVAQADAWTKTRPLLIGLAALAIALVVWLAMGTSATPP
jgi:hypothetical protein